MHIFKDKSNKSLKIYSYKTQDSRRWDQNLHWNHLLLKTYIKNWKWGRTDVSNMVSSNLTWVLFFITSPRTTSLPLAYGIVSMSGGATQQADAHTENNSQWALRHLTMFIDEQLLYNSFAEVAFFQKVRLVTGFMFYYSKISPFIHTIRKVLTWSSLAFKHICIKCPGITLRGPCGAQTFL